MTNSRRQRATCASWAFERLHDLPRTRQTGPAIDSKICRLPASPLRNRTVDLLLTMATPPRPGCTTCTNGTPECSGSTACTQCARHPVHDPFYDQQAASGPRITLGDGVQVTLSERRTVTRGRARERADQDARRPFRTPQSMTRDQTWEVDRHAAAARVTAGTADRPSAPSCLEPSAWQ